MGGFAVAGDVSWGDVCGIAGVVLYVGSYFALQAGLIRGLGYVYAAVNTAAAVAVLLSLFEAFNLSSAIIQVIWIFIGVYGMSRYYVTRRGIRFTDEERVFLKVIAPGLERLDARRLLDLGRWKTALQGVELTEQDEVPSHVHFFLAGSAEVSISGRMVGQLGPTSAVGELEFLRERPATATVTVTRPSRIFSMEALVLRAHLERHPGVRAVLESRFGSQLGDKLSSTHQSLATIKVPLPLG